jgi:hypothetical protein
MDPSTNLQEQMHLARKILQIVDECPEDGSFTTEQLEDLAEHAPRLAELVMALDGWLRRGGFLPERWQHKEIP